MQSELQKLEDLFQLASLLGHQHDFQEVLRLITAKATALFDAEAVSIQMNNPSTFQTVKTVIKVGQGNRKRYQLAQTNIIGWTMKNKQPFLSNDLLSDTRFRKGMFEDIPFHAAMCVPLYSERVIIGYLLVMGKKSHQIFTESELRLLEKMASVTAPFLSNIQQVQQYFNVPLPFTALLEKYKTLHLLGKSESFVELLRAIEAAAHCDVRVLIEGKTGTGKELVARAIHQLSSRQKQAFVAVDCGAIPEHLIESELFGHVKGAFTGATRDRKGLMAEADRGTLFMDEIANLPLEMQAKLMRVLQEEEVRPLGSNQVRKVNTRVIAASSASVSDLVAEEKFRADLYYRLMVYPIYVPALEERREDIPLLAHYFLKRFAEKQQKQVQHLHGTVLEYIKQHSWPGNIRELENFLERLVTFAPADQEVIDLSILPRQFQQEIEKVLERTGSTKTSFKERMQKYEEELLRKALIDHEWNQSAAARSLDIPEQTLRYKMQNLGIVKRT